MPALRFHSRARTYGSSRAEPVHALLNLGECGGLRPIDGVRISDHVTTSAVPATRSDARVVPRGVPVRHGVYFSAAAERPGCRDRRAESWRCRTRSMEARYRHRRSATCGMSTRRRRRRAETSVPGSECAASTAPWTRCNRVLRRNCRLSCDSEFRLVQWRGLSSHSAVPSRLRGGGSD
jgi:hypothetical protein